MKKIVIIKNYPQDKALSECLKILFPECQIQIVPRQVKYKTDEIRCSKNGAASNKGLKHAHQQD